MNSDLKQVLLILQEECAEVIQAVSKINRFGPDQIKTGRSQTNMEHLMEELGDTMAMIELLTNQNVGVTEEGLALAKQAKFEKLKLWSTLTITK
tara:strand:+ start:330 stop:611 length:282 start_codon:yes stop_codon:yes gene_type:complete